MTPRQHAEKIMQRFQKIGTLQLRLWQGMFLTYPYPAKRGYGTRGELLGVYSAETTIEWLEEDIIAVLGDSKTLNSFQK